MQDTYLCLVRIICLRYLYLCFCALALQATAQPTIPPAQADSLWKIWSNKSEADSNRLIALYKYTMDGYLYSKPDSAFYFAKLQIELARTNPDLKVYVAKALNIQGASLLIRSQYREAVKIFEECLEIYTELNNRTGMATVLNNIGMIFKEQGDYTRSLNHYARSMELYEAVGDRRGVAISYGNIGLIYQDQKDLDKALDYFKRSLAIDEELDNPLGIATTLSNIGSVYFDQHKYDEAREKFEKSMAISQEIGDDEGVAYCLNSLGLLYKELGNLPKAIQLINQCLEISNQIENLNLSCAALRNLANIYAEQKQPQKAVAACLKSLEIAREIGSIMEQKLACECLYNNYKEMGKGVEALEYHELMLLLTDSLGKENTSRQLQQMEFQKAMLQDSIANAEEKRKIQEAHDEEIRKKNNTRRIAYMAGGVLLLIAAGLYSRLRYVRKSKAALQIEKDRSENLLLNILPEEIAQELKEKGEASARDYDAVSIMFTDFKGFTETSAKLSAGELVNEINHCFRGFDQIIEKYGIEKIKTIGDAYMAAGGLPVPSENSIKNTVLAALEMQQFIADRKKQNEIAGKAAFEMRVGIHTGPVVAGIVGVKKFQYDIWGDTVNTASRVESNGEPGRVNISHNTYHYLKDDPDLVFESRGKIAAKGKGEMEMYFVYLKKAP